MNQFIEWYESQDDTFKFEMNKYQHSLHYLSQLVREINEHCETRPINQLEEKFIVGMINITDAFITMFLPFEAGLSNELGYDQIDKKFKEDGQFRDFASSSHNLVNDVCQIRLYINLLYKGKEAKEHILSLCPNSETLKFIHDYP